MPAARHPARRRPGRLRLLPPRPAALGHPRSARPAHSSSRTCTPTTAAPRAPTTARSSPTGTSTAPAHPRPLLELGPLARTATPAQAAQHDAKTAEAARYKLGRLTSDDADGYHRVACPAAAGKIRCPLRPASMTLDRDRPEILQPRRNTPRPAAPEQTITVPPDVLAKTAQKHDYPSAAWRRSYARRSGAERGFATAKDPATNDISPRLVPPHGPGPAHAVHRDCCSSSATSASSPPGMPARKKTSAAPPGACPRKPAGAAARPSPRPHPPPRPDSRPPAPPARTPAPRQRQHARTTTKASPEQQKGRLRRPQASPARPGPPSRPERQTQT